MICMKKRTRMIGYKKYIVTLLMISLPLFGKGDFRIKIVNNTKDPLAKIYITIKGLNPDTKRATFIGFSKPEEVGHYVDITGAEAGLPLYENPSNPTAYHPDKIKKSLECAYDYTFFKNSSGEYIIRVPYLESGRVYISINKKLEMPIVGSAQNPGIADPNPFNTGESNYTVLYDKVEFTYFMVGNQAQTVINPTAVDALALPIAVEQGKRVGNTVERVLYGITAPRNETFAKIESMLSGPGIDPEWKRLIIKDENGTILRIIAPGRDNNFFDQNYLSKEPYNYIQDLWNYYKTRTLKIDCLELQHFLPKLGSYYFSGQVNENNEFVFTNENNSHTEKIDMPTSNNFFLASQGTFEAANNTVRAVIVRNMCAAWSVGFLPAPNNTTLTREYYLKNKDTFYSRNELIATAGKQNGPWYDLYAKAIHQVSKDIYAWAYDDALGLDGTNFSTDEFPATITIGPLGTKTSAPPASADIKQSAQLGKTAQTIKKSIKTT